MHRLFGDKQSDKNPAIEKEAKAIYRFIEHLGWRLKVIKLWYGLEAQISCALNIYSKTYETIDDNYFYHRNGIFIDIEWKFKEIVDKELGLPVLKRVKELADEKIGAIRRDFSQSPDAEDIHDIAKSCADVVIGEKEYFNDLIEMLAFRREREATLAALRP